MTRINIGIPPSTLTGRHLIAEHLEIKRIPNLIKRRRLLSHGIPPQFTLGKGHVKFFYNKLGYLKKRYQELRKECLGRGYHVQDFSSAWDGIPDELMGDYEPREEDTLIVAERIKSKTTKIK
jgi:hypothetical protein